MNIRLVTGHVRLPSADFYRSPDDFRAYGKRLFAATQDIPKTVFEEMSVQSCWLYPHICDNLIGGAVTVPLSAQGNPAKDTVDYMTVLAQKTEWLSQAFEKDPAADVYVWMDYGIFHQEGFTEELVSDFFKRVRLNDLAFPGLWGKGPVPENDPCWRFLGSMFVCPANQVENLNFEVKKEILKHLVTTGHVLWDINNWARVEEKDVLPIRWYLAGHNSTMLTNY
jgi:hypothetical protein